MSASDDVTGARVTALEGRIDRHDESSVREHTDLWNAIASLRKSVNDITKRPPAWCTVAISLLTFLLGITVTLIGVLVRM